MRVHSLRLLSTLAALGFSAVACGQEITVSAAVSLQNPMREIGAAFEQSRPGTKVHFNFSASGPLLAQITQGAPVDVFASADSDTMHRAQLRQLIDASSRLDFAGNELVLVSPRADASAHRALADMTRAHVQRIALGTPGTVPAGRYAQAALSAHGLWGQLQPKLVFADNVRQALSYVSRGEVQAGLVYRTEALLEKGKVRIDLVVPTATAIRYPAAVVRASAQPRVAGDFVRFLRAPAAQAVLARHGFNAAPAP